MKYILDFDRTVFDTDSLYKKLHEHDSSEKAGTMDSLETLGDISGLVFEDAKKFFAGHNKEDLFIVSSCKGKSGNWEKDYQEKKIENSGVGEFVNKVFIVESGKEEVVSNLVKKFKEETVFIDDMAEHLESLSSVDETLLLVQICRNNSHCQGLFLTISQLSELDDIIKGL